MSSMMKSKAFCFVMIGMIAVFGVIMIFVSIDASQKLAAPEKFQYDGKASNVKLTSTSDQYVLGSQTYTREIVTFDFTFTRTANGQVYTYTATYTAMGEKVPDPDLYSEVKVNIPNGVGAIRIAGTKVPNTTHLTVTNLAVLYYGNV